MDTGLRIPANAVPKQHLPDPKQNILTLAFAEIGRKGRSFLGDDKEKKPPRRLDDREVSERETSGIKEAIFSGNGLSSIVENCLIESMGPELYNFDTLINLADYCEDLANKLLTTKIPNMLDDRYPYTNLSEEKRKNRETHWDNNTPIEYEYLDKLRQEADSLIDGCTKIIIDTYLAKCLKIVVNENSLVKFKTERPEIAYKDKFMDEYEKLLGVIEKIDQCLGSVENKEFNMSQYSKHIKNSANVFRKLAWVKRYSKDAFLPKSLIYGLIPTGIPSEVLGKGGEGQVTLASLGLLHQVALKPQEKDIDHNEIKQLFGLIHPNVVQLIGAIKTCSCYEEHDSCSCKIDYIIMERIDLGVESYLQSVAENFQNTPLSKTFCLYFLQDVCAGMEYLNSKGLIHRDLKPHNILMTRSEPGVATWRGTFKIADFGLLRSITSKIEDGQDVLISVQGTPQYMAPELTPKYGQKYTFEEAKKVDVFSFGVMIYRVLLQIKPYENLSHNQIIVFVPDEEKFNPYKLHLPKTVPSYLQTLFHACYSWDPSKRPSFEDMKNEPFCLNTKVVQEINGISDNHHRFLVKEWQKEVQQNLITQESTVNDATCTASSGSYSQISNVTVSSINTQSSDTSVAISVKPQEAFVPKPYSYLDENLFVQAFEKLKYFSDDLPKDITLDQMLQPINNHEDRFTGRNQLGMGINFEWMKSQVIESYGAIRVLMRILDEVQSNMINLPETIHRALFYELCDLEKENIPGLVDDRMTADIEESPFLMDAFRKEFDALAAHCAKILTDLSIETAKRRMVYSSRSKEYQLTLLNREERNRRSRDFRETFDKMREIRDNLFQCIDNKVDEHFYLTAYTRHLRNSSQVLKQLAQIKKYQMYKVFPKSFVNIIDDKGIEIHTDDGPEMVSLSALVRAHKIHNNVERKITAKRTDVMGLFYLKDDNLLQILGVTQSCDCLEKCSCLIDHVLFEPTFCTLENYLQIATKRWNESGILPVKEFSANTCNSIISAMCYLNSQKLVHGNLKPHNILLTYDPFESENSAIGASKFLKIVDSEFIELITPNAGLFEGELRNNVRYMVPELVGKNDHSKERSLGFTHLSDIENWEIIAKADVFSFALIIYRVLLLFDPYDGFTDDQVLYNLRYRKFELKIPNDVPENLRNVFNACYKWGLNDRPTFEELDKKHGYFWMRIWNEFRALNWDDKDAYERRWKLWRQEAMTQNAKTREVLNQGMDLHSSFGNLNL